MENTKQVSIETEVYELLNDAAEKRKVTPDKLANQLLDKEIHRKFYKFFNGSKWFIPRNTFIAAGLRQEEWKKLRGWLDKKDVVTVNTMNNGQILILNQTKLDKHHAANPK